MVKLVFNLIFIHQIRIKVFDRLLSWINHLTGLMLGPKIFRANSIFKDIKKFKLFTFHVIWKYLKSKSLSLIHFIQINDFWKANKILVSCHRFFIFAFRRFSILELFLVLLPLSFQAQLFRSLRHSFQFFFLLLWRLLVVLSLSSTDSIETPSERISFCWLLLLLSDALAILGWRRFWGWISYSSSSAVYFGS